MAYLPDSFERSTTGWFNEKKLQLPQMLTSPFEPRMIVESYELPDDSTIFAALSYAALDAQGAANKLEQPLRSLDELGPKEPWQNVQRGLRYVGHARRRVRRAARGSGQLETLQAVRQDALELSSVMNFTGTEQIRHAEAEVFSYTSSHREAKKDLKLVSSKKLQELISVVLGRDIDVKQLKDWLRAVRKRPDATEDFESFFEGLRAEMMAEGFDVDSNDELLENLSSSEYRQLQEAIWQEIFESFKAYDDDDDAPDTDIYIRSGDIPASVKNDKQTRIDLGVLGLDLFFLNGGYKGPVDFRTPVVGRVIRPALVWQRAADGTRHLRFDTYLYGRDELREQVFHYSPLVGAAALAAKYGDAQKYRRTLDAMNPYELRPKKDEVTPRERAGLGPLAWGADTVPLGSDYITQLELLVEERR